MEREIMETRATGKTFVCGDIHGAYKALLQVFERSGFDKKTDKLICLGDVVDGWSESVEVIRELAKIKNLVYVIGNHDFWTIDYLKTGYKEPLWVSQGGKATLHSFSIHVYKGLVREMLSFFDKGVHYHKED
jgi:serine/threonine protein phosphatase 1